MSNEKHETVADNVSANHQFREVAKMIPHQEVDVSKMETTTPNSEKSSAVGNAAAMREALEKIANMGEEIDYQLGSSDETVYAFRNERSLAHSISECARTALSAPPRNCDAFSKAQVLEMLEDRSFSKEDTIEWLFAEAKGATDGSK